ncbi:chondroadherin-like [Pseudophryne corroboree]|uniref:chondroadherin-like n=1 Tax=Pseudophryne corroboree TaxID=495146 RepID=UPI0030814BC9
MVWSYLILMAVLMKTCVISLPTALCPERCTCLPLQRHVLCSNANFTSIPSEIQNTTTELHLQDNNFSLLQSSFLKNLPDLRALYLSNCNVEDIQPGAFQEVTGIEHLYLDSNELHRIQEGTFSNLSNLLYLHLEKNKIDYLHPGIFSALNKLTALYLNFNSLTELTDGSLKGLTQLRWLDLGFNALSNISRKAFEDVPYIRNLNLEMNNLTRVSSAIRITSNLQKLRLSGNRIRKLTSISLKSVKELYLDNMGLEKASSLAFSRIRMLEVLDLRNNSLTSLPVSRIKSNTKIYLSGNPWRCDCSIVALYVRLLLGDKNNPQQQVQCQSPKALEGRSLTTLNILHLNCKSLTEDSTTATPGNYTEGKLVNSPPSVAVTTRALVTPYKIFTPATSVSTTVINKVDEDPCLADYISNVLVKSMGEESLQVSWSVSRTYKSFQIVYSADEDRGTLHILGEPMHAQLYHLHPGTIYTVCIVPQNIDIAKCQKPKPGQCANGQTDDVPEQTYHVNSPPSTNSSPFVIIGSFMAVVVLVAAVCFILYTRRTNNFQFQRYHDEDGIDGGRKQETDPDKWDDVYENVDEDRHIYVTASSLWGMDNEKLDCSLADSVPLPSCPKYVTL